jgi:hypothetical protein
MNPTPYGLFNNIYYNIINSQLYSPIMPCDEYLPMSVSTQLSIIDYRLIMAEKEIDSENHKQYNKRNVMAGGYTTHLMPRPVNQAKVRPFFRPHRFI